jgi:ketosteroid isomerase-like protein
VQEIVVAGDLAYCWSRLRVEIEPIDGGPKIVHAGDALSILRRSDGTWRVMRDANLLTAAD